MKQHGSDNMDEFEELARSLAGDIDPAQRNGFTQDSKEEIIDEPAAEVEEPKIESEDSAEQVEAADSDEEVTADESESESKDDDAELEESDNEEVDESIDESEDDVVSEDTHKVTVDGEELDVSLQDLKDNFAGKQAWDQKFSELNNEKEVHSKAVEKFSNNANQFQELVKEGKAQEALDFVLEVAGLDRNQFVEQYVSQLAPTISEYLELSPEEREQRVLKQQLEHYKGQQERTEKANSESRAASELSSKVESVMSEHSMSPDRFESLQKELIEFGVKDITPEAIGQYHVMVVQQDAALEVLNEINPELVKDKSAMDYLLSLQKNNPGITKEQLKTRAEKAFIDALSERVKKDSKAAKPRKKGAPKTTKEKVAKGILTFDDLENINALDLLGE